jgi:hypothetical protein
MGGMQIVLVSTAGFSVLNTGIFWREAKTKRLFSQCGSPAGRLFGRVAKRSSLKAWKWKFATEF